MQLRELKGPFSSSLKRSCTFCRLLASLNKTGCRWIKKGSIVQEPQKGHADATLKGGPPAQYDHTSMLATAKNLFGLHGFLTKRDVSRSQPFPFRRDRWWLRKS